MDQFKAIFGFSKPTHSETRNHPNDDLMYGCAAYGNLNSEHPERFEWFYEIGNFDFIWGYYRALQSIGLAQALAIYALDEDGIPVGIINEVALTSQRKECYGEKSSHGTIYADLVVEPEEYEGIPPVDFGER